MHRIEPDRSQWPQALIESEAIVKDFLDTEEQLEGLITIDQSMWYGGVSGREPRGTRTRVLYQESKDSPRRHIAFIQIEEAAYDDYKEWFKMKMDEKRQAFRDGVSRKLVADGYYKKNSAGLRQAVKISQILLNVGSEISMDQLLEIDGKLYDGTNVSEAYSELRKLPVLVNGDEVPSSVRLAIRRLADAGMVVLHGGKKNRTYSLGNWEG